MLNFLVKSKLLVKLSFKSGFSTFRASLALVILRQAFIEVSIFNHLGLKDCIGIKNNISK